MDIVYLIGNGFDIKLGLKTRYAEFYKWYMTREPSEYAAVNEFRSAIDPNHELWADMEWAMCQYLKEVKREEDAVRIFEDVQDNLQQYIAMQDEEAELMDNSNYTEFAKSFFFPDEFFPPATQRIIRTKINFQSDNLSTRIILFNYTTSIERLLTWTGSKQTYKIYNGISYRQYLQEIEHIHGFCDERGRLALGCDSPGQIANPDLAMSLAVTDRYVKSNYNETFELDHAEKCANWIKKARAIVIYGLSIGRTDQRWWDEVASNLRRDTRTILFVHFKRDCRLTGNGGPAYQEQKRKDRVWLLERLGIEEEIVENRIFITYDDNWMKPVDFINS